MFDYERPDAYIVKSDKYSDTYSTPVLTANKGFILGYTNEIKVCDKECIIFDDFTLDSKYVTFPFMVKSSALKILTAKMGYFLPFAYQLLQATNIEILGHARHYISVVQPTKVLIPSNDEQIRIGKCIQQIDNLITLHQRKQNKQFLGVQLEKCCEKIANSWEQRKAGTLFISFVEKGFPDLPVLSATQDKGMVYRDDSGKMVFHDKNNESGYKRVQPGQFVIHLRSFQGGFAHSNILGITSPAYTIFGFKEGESQYDLFWKSIFSSSDFIRRLESVTYGIRDGRSISYDEFLTMKFFIPKYNEQVKIATCLMKIDDLITLHQCKYFLCSNKNVIFHLQQSISKMTNSWEQCKLGNYFDERTERSADGELISVTISSGIKKFSELNRHDTTPDDMSHYKVVCIGDIAYNSMRMWQGASGYSPYKGILSPAYTVITPKNGVSSRFFAYLLKLPKMISLFGVHSQGLTKDTWNLKFPAFSEIECSAPSDIREQNNIASALEQLDNLITLHQCKYFNHFFNFSSHFVRFKKCKKANSWEQRKFKELYDRVSEKNDLSYGVEQIISVANMYYKADSSISDKEYLRTYNVFELGDIAFEGNKSKDFKHGRFVENTIGNGIVSHVFDVFRPIMLRYDLLYWKYAINNERIMGQVLMRCTKASTMMTNLVARDFLEEHILVPEYEEQKRIGIVITKLDNLITLHQRKFKDFHGGFL